MAPLQFAQAFYAGLFAGFPDDSSGAAGMMSPLVLALIKIMFVMVLFTTFLIIMQRTISSLFSIYAVQSLLMALIALMLFTENGQPVLLALAVLTVVSKVILIPYDDRENSQ